MSLLTDPYYFFMKSELAKKKCIPCKGGVAPLKGKDLQDIYQKLDPQWKIINEHHLEKLFKFKDFKQALDFTVQVGTLAEQEWHHPDIYLAWGLVKITLWTHKIDGLSES